jgi:hypothetical protein
LPGYRFNQFGTSRDLIGFLTAPAMSLVLRGLCEIREVRGRLARPRIINCKKNRPTALFRHFLPAGRLRFEQYRWQLEDVSRRLVAQKSTTRNIEQ